MHDPKDDWNNVSHGPNWHPPERADPPMMDEDDFPDDATLAAADNNHAVPSTSIYKGDAKAMRDADKDPEPLEKLLADIDIDALSNIQVALKFNHDAVKLAQEVLEGQEPPEGFNRKEVLALGEKASRNLVKVAEQKRTVAVMAANNAMALDKRQAFLEDRAVAVVKQTLLALDDRFLKVGFGAWMPFRYADQWLMFCGVMSRVLAANGLVHSENPEAYRKILEETPPVEDQQPHTPESWATCWSNRGARTINELRYRTGLSYEAEEGQPVSSSD